MGALAEHLQKALPGRIHSDDEGHWAEVSALLSAGEGLEVALHKVVVSSALTEAIIQTTADFILHEETAVLTGCLDAGRVLRFTLLLPHLSPASPKFVEVITPNYDRLIEFAVESAGWGVDTGFLGRIWGQHNPIESDKSFAKAVVQHSKTPKLLYRDRVRLYKPHGSLDWFETASGVVCSSLPLSAKRLLITPGVSKYKHGYDQPFDSHREGANAALDRARAILCVGYGFNDDHLQTHLTPLLKRGVPAVLLTHGLTEAAADVIQASPNSIALIHHADGTAVVTSKGIETVPVEQWWDLEHFIKGVLEP